MSTKEVNLIKLRNKIEKTVAEARAETAIAGIERNIESYRSGYLTAKELLEYFRESAENQSIAEAQLDRSLTKENLTLSLDNLKIELEGSGGSYYY